MQIPDEVRKKFRVGQNLDRVRIIFWDWATINGLGQVLQKSRLSNHTYDHFRSARQMKQYFFRVYLNSGLDRSKQSHTLSVIQPIVTDSFSMQGPGTHKVTLETCAPSFSVYKEVHFISFHTRNSPATIRDIFPGQITTIRHLCFNLFSGLLRHQITYLSIYYIPGCQDKCQMFKVFL